MTENDKAIFFLDNMKDAFKYNPFNIILRVFIYIYIHINPKLFHIASFKDA